MIDEQRIGGALGTAVSGGICDDEGREVNDRRVEVRDGDEDAVEPVLQVSGGKRQEQVDEQCVDQYLAERGNREDDAVTKRGA